MKKIFSIIMLICATTGLMAQTKSFIVTNKSGNSQFVQNLIFQKDDMDNRFSWSTSGGSYDHDFDIENLQFIARAKEEMKTASAEEVTEMLEELSGTDQASANAIANVLQDNPNVEEAYTADDANVVVRMRGKEGITVYPMYDLKPTFSETYMTSDVKHLLNKANNNPPSKKESKYNRVVYGNVAIFNFFSDDVEYDIQNTLVEALDYDFYHSNYKVDLYKRDQFTEENLSRVLDEAKNNQYKNYSAILIFSHGMLLNRSNMIREAEAQLITGESVEESNICDRWYNAKDGKYYKIIPMKMDPGPDCALYMGACYGTCWGQPYTGNGSRQKDALTLIGWDGINCIAQAHAAILFTKMLFYEMDLKTALESSFNHDPLHPETEFYYSIKKVNEFGKLKTPKDEPNYDWGDYYDICPQTDPNRTLQNVSISFDQNNDFFIKNISDTQYLQVSGRLHGSYNHNIIKILFIPILGGKMIRSQEESAYLINSSGTFVTRVAMPSNTPEGVYSIGVKGWSPSDKKFNKYIKMSNPLYFVYSKQFNENYALPVCSEEDFRKPIVLDESNQETESLDVLMGDSKTYIIDGYPGHTFLTLSLDKSIVTAEINGNQLILKGMSEGVTMVGVIDEQNKQLVIADVTVTAKPTPPVEMETITVNGVSFNMIKVDGGSFMMGATAEQEEDATDGEYPVHQVSLSDYYIGETEVTQELWKAVMGSNPSQFTSSDQLPIHFVSWSDCNTFITKLNELTGQTFRLPTEAEWEFAARGGNASQGFKYSGSNEIEQVAWYSDNSGETSHLVATKAPNELGIYDMSGNVSEWCKEQHYSYNSVSNPSAARPVSSYGPAMIIRGGSWGDDAKLCRVSARDGWYDTPMWGNVGMRLAMSNVEGSTEGATDAIAVDLGLPSGTKWADRNVGASKPEDYGGYYAWGEIKEKEVYDWSTYKWCNGSDDTQIKYCTDSSYGTVDNKTTLDLEDDVAHVKWGGSWKMPTIDQVNELLDNCSSEWTTVNGIDGRRFTSKINSNSIFLPAAGVRLDSGLYYVGLYGDYWSSALYEDYPPSACLWNFDPYYAFRGDGTLDSRFYGQSVRPVTK